MLAGYDYLFLKGGPRRFWTRTRIAGASLLIAGGILIGVGGAYYGYADNARDNLANLQVSSAEIVPVFEKSEPALPEPFSLSAIPEGSLYSGDAGMDPSEIRVNLPDGFSLIDASESASLVPQSPATSLNISTVSIDASIVELSILDLGDRRAYQTPSNTVGHIPETSDAGENGAGWYFGHTESPVLNEGSVFFNLQEIPEKLKKGEDVQIVIGNGTEEFLYQVTGTRVVHEDDLTLESSGGPTIHLVSCVPRLVYDHRLIVDAELIARKSTT